MKKNYTDPLFQEILDSVPRKVRGEVDRSFDIAQRIDSLLQQKGWSQTELAKRTGKKCSEISKWLSGTQNFTLRTIALIEDALDADLICVVGHPSITIAEKEDSSYSSIWKMFVPISKNSVLITESMGDLNSIEEKETAAA